MSESTKRRWFRFSLRSLFILVTLCCLAMGWYVVRVLPQKRAIAAIRADGGSCQYNYLQNSWQFDRYGAFHWLPELLGEDLFYSVFSVTLSPSSDATLVHVGNLTTLRALHLQHGGYTDEGLRHLSRLRELSALAIEASSISGQGFSVFADLPRFEVLELIFCNELTTAGQRQIGGLGHLTKFMAVSCDSVTADCLRPIIARGKLVRLCVSSCPQVDFTQLDLTPLGSECVIQFIPAPTSTAPASFDSDAGDQT